jgi:hypothetical protein
MLNLTGNCSWVRLNSLCGTRNLTGNSLSLVLVAMSLSQIQWYLATIHNLFSLANVTCGYSLSQIQHRMSLATHHNLFSLALQMSLIDMSLSQIFNHRLSLATQHNPFSLAQQMLLILPGLSPEAE